MRRVLTVSIPAGEVAALRDILGTLRAVKEESMARGARARAGDLTIFDELIRAAESHDVGGAPLELSGPAGLIRDAAYGLLLDGADALADVCRSYEAGRSSLDELVAAGESAARRLALMKRVEDSDGWSPD
jgi:hypothetical protein